MNQIVLNFQNLILNSDKKENLKKVEKCRKMLYDVICILFKDEFNFYYI